MNPDFSGAAHPLNEEDIEKAAKTLGVNIACIVAVDVVESNGTGGYLSDGSNRPVILFEAHKFSRHTGGKFNVDYPWLSSPTWNRALYRGGKGEYERLYPAVKLNREAALKSTSWGRYQILGENYGACSYPSVEKFVEAMAYSEGLQLDAFVNFVIFNGLDKYLRIRDWAGFARGYNGTAYRENKYDVKLAAAYRQALGVSVPQDIKTLRAGDRGPEVLALQQALNRNGAMLIPDGIFGRATQIAVENYQAANRLVVDGVAGPNTLKLLQA